MKKICLVKLTLVLSVLILSNCSVTKLQKQGSVEPDDFYSKLDFATKKTVIVLRGELNGKTRNFLFDTGADISVIQRDTTVGKISKYSGASKRKMKLGKEVLESLELSGVKFLNTRAVNGDLVGLKEQIPDFGGIIGQSVINKANWLIDYPNKQLEISNRELSDDSFKSLEIQREHGAPYTFLTINGKQYKVIIDFGSSSAINLPKNSRFAKELANMIDLRDNERKRYTLGGLQTIIEKVGVIPKVRLGDFEFENVDVNINTSSQARIGISLFKDYVIYIDNLNNEYKLKK